MLILFFDFSFRGFVFSCESSESLAELNDIATLYEKVCFPMLFAGLNLVLNCVVVVVVFVCREKDIWLTTVSAGLLRASSTSTRDARFRCRRWTQRCVICDSRCV